MANHYLPAQQVDAVAPLTWYNVYTAGHPCVGSSLVICNRSSSQALIRVALRPSGAALAGKHYLAYDPSIDPYDSITLTQGLTFIATDMLDIYSSVASVNASFFGSEIY